MCSGSATFTANSFPPGYYWGKSSNLDISNPFSNTITATINGTGYAWVALYDGINSGAKVTHNVFIGTSSIIISGPSDVIAGAPGSSPGNMFTISSYTGPSVLEIQWYINPGAGVLYDYGTYIIVYVYNAGIFRLEARARNDCGWGPWEYYYGNASRQTSTPLYKVYPNPVTDILFIDIDSQQNLSNLNTNQFRYDIRLCDMQGNLALNTTTTQTGTVKIDVSNLRNGIYVLKIFDGMDPQPFTQIIIKQ